MFNTESFMPHGHCFLWKPGILWLHVLSDIIIAISYFIIPVCLAFILGRRSDIPVGYIVWCFAGFILLCGLTHIFGIITIWKPIYQIEGAFKALTAVFSIGTAVALVGPVKDVLLSLPTLSQYREKAEELQIAQGQIEKMQKQIDSFLENSNLASIERIAEEIAKRERESA